MPDEQLRHRRRKGYRLAALGAGAPLQFTLSRRKTVVGRDSDCDLVLDDDLISRRHAILRWRFSTLRLIDLESHNGTFVNGVRISPSASLRPGDEIRFGGRRFALLSPVGAGARNRSSLKPRTLVEIFVALVIVAFGASEFILNRRLAAENASLARAHLAAAESARPAAALTPAPAATTAMTAARVGAHAAVTPAPAAAPPRAPASSAPSSVRPAAAAPEKPAAAPASTAVPAPAAAEPPWLARVNYYRRMAKLYPVAQDPALSAGDAAHARYLLRNDRAEIKDGTAGADMHTENSSMPGYTTAGLKAAKASDVDMGWSVSRSFRMRAAAPIDGWMTAPFHRISILNPNLHRVGYGEVCSQGFCVAALNVGTDADLMPYAGTVFPSPVIFPPAGATVPLRSFRREWPNPLTSCPGYTTPAGLPITVQFGAWIAPHLTAYSFCRQLPSGQALQLDACGFDATSYVNSNDLAEHWARTGLKDAGAVVVVPRAPLIPGASYAVSMTVNGKPYAWSFNVAPGAK